MFRVHRVQYSQGQVFINKLRSGALTVELSQAQKKWKTEQKMKMAQIYWQQRSKYTGTRGSKKVRRSWKINSSIINV